MNKKLTIFLTKILEKKTTMKINKTYYITLNGWKNKSKMSKPESKKKPEGKKKKNNAKRRGRKRKRNMKRGKKREKKDNNSERPERKSVRKNLNKSDKGTLTETLIIRLSIFVRL